VTAVGTVAMSSVRFAILVKVVRRRRRCSHSNCSYCWRSANVRKVKLFVYSATRGIYTVVMYVMFGLLVTSDICWMETHTCI